MSSSRTPTRTLRSSSAAAGSPRFSGSGASGTTVVKTPRSSQASLQVQSAASPRSNSRNNSTLAAPVSILRRSSSPAGATNNLSAKTPDRSRSKSPNGAGGTVAGSPLLSLPTGGRLSSFAATASNTSNRSFNQSSAVGAQTVTHTAQTNSTKGLPSSPCGVTDNSATSRQRAGSLSGTPNNGAGSRPQTPRGRPSTTPIATEALEERITTLSEELAKASEALSRQAEIFASKEKDLSTKLKESQDAYTRMLGKHLLEQRQRTMKDKSQQESNRKLTHINIAISKEEDAIQKSLDEQEQQQQQHQPTTGNNASSTALATKASRVFTPADLAFTDPSNNTASVDAGGHHNLVSRESVEVRRLRRELTQKTAALTNANDKIVELESAKITLKSDVERARREALMAAREKEGLQHQTDRLRIENNLKVGGVELELAETQSKLVSAERKIVSLEHQNNTFSNELKVAKSKLKAQTDSDERQGTIRDQLLAASIAKVQAEDTIDRQRRAAVEANEAIAGLTEECALLRLELDKYRAASVKAGIILQYTPIPQTDLSRLGKAGGAGGGTSGYATPSLSATAQHQLQHHLQQLLGVGGVPAGGHHRSNSIHLSPAALEGSIRVVANSGQGQGVSPSVRSRSNSVMVQQQSNAGYGLTSPGMSGGLGASVNSLGSGTTSGHPLLVKNSSFHTINNANGTNMLNASIVAMGGGAAGATSATNTVSFNSGGLVYDPLANYQIALADPTKEYACVETKAAKKLFSLERDALLSIILEGFANFEVLFNTHRAMLGTTAQVVEKAVEQMAYDITVRERKERDAKSPTATTHTSRALSPNAGHNTLGLGTFAAGVPPPPFVGGGVAPPRGMNVSPNRVGNSRSASPSLATLAHLRQAVGGTVGKYHSPNGPHNNQNTSSAPSATTNRSVRAAEPFSTIVAAPTRVRSFSGRIGQSAPTRSASSTLAVGAGANENSTTRKANGISTPRFATPGRSTSGKKAVSDTAASSKGSASAVTATSYHSPPRPFSQTTTQPPFSTSPSASHHTGVPTPPHEHDEQYDDNNGNVSHQADGEAQLGSKRADSNVPLSHHRTRTPPSAVALRRVASPYSVVRHVDLSVAEIVKQNSSSALLPLAGRDGGVFNINDVPPFVGTWYNTCGKDALRAWLSLVNVFSPALENALHVAGFTDMISIAHITESDLIRLSITAGLRRKLLAAVEELQRKMAIIREQTEAVLRKTYAISNKFAAELEIVGDWGDDVESENENQSSRASGDENIFTDPATPLFVKNDEATTDIIFDIPSGEAPASAVVPQQEEEENEASKLLIRAAAKNNALRREEMKKRVEQKLLGSFGHRGVNNNNKNNNGAQPLNTSNLNDVIDTGNSWTPQGVVERSSSSAQIFGISSDEIIDPKDPRARIDALFRDVHDWFADVRVAIVSQDESVERILNQTSLQK